VSTINRTLKAYGLAVAGAEYLAGVVPRGTHHWEKFVTPKELAKMLEEEEEGAEAGARVRMRVRAINGMVMVPEISFTNFSVLNPSWKLSTNDFDVNYILHAQKT
jgi:2-polyprenyl-3-methyl-5-hydroxy-6-metoxy-1,4-benzoquinol methylase